MLRHGCVRREVSKEPGHHVALVLYRYNREVHQFREVVSGVVLPAVVSHDIDYLEHRRVPLLEERTRPGHAVKIK